MENKAKSYREELAPLWWEGFRSWIWGGTWGQTVTSIVFAVGIPFLYLYFEEVDIAIENLRQLAFAVLIGLFWYFLIAIITFVGANIKLYESQIKRRKELGDFLENPFKVAIYKPDRRAKEREPKWASLGIHNEMQNKQINGCRVRLDDFIDLKTHKHVLRDMQHFQWSAREHNKVQDGNQPLDIVAGDFGVLDVAKADPNAPNCKFTVRFGDQYIDPGEYIVCFTVFGNWDTLSKNYEYHMRLYFEGTNELRLMDVKEGRYEQKSPA